MYLNIIGPLITAIISYVFFVGKIQYAAQAALVFIIIWGFLKLSPPLYRRLMQAKTKKRARSKSQKKEQGREITAYVCLIIITALLIIGDSSFLHNKVTLYQFKRITTTLPTNLITTAIKQLKAHPNKIQVCAPLFFPDLQHNNPQAIATYLAYYYGSEKYCSQYWPWGRDDCNYLKEYEYGRDHTAATKNIFLCRWAKSKAFLSQVQAGDQNNATQKK